MDYLYSHNYPLIIYHMFDSPRNTPHNISVSKFKMGVLFKGGFKSDEERDSAMTKGSDFDIAFIKDKRWNSGTAQNIKRRHEISNNLFNNSDYISDSTND